MNHEGLFSLIFSVAAAGVSAYCAYKVKQIDDKLDKSVDRISDAVKDIDISDTLIEDAVNRAVDKQAKQAAAAAVVQIKHDILNEVRKSVNEAYGDTKEEVKRTLEKKIGDIDISDLRKKVADEAAEKAKQKFDSDLNDILKEYNKQIDSVGKIYDSIASSLSNRKQSEGTYLKIGG